MVITPPYLKKGNTIGLLCPAGFMPLEKAETCINILHEWGYKTVVGKTLGSQHHYFSATYEDRLADLQQMLDDDSIHAILCARGGYGISRIVDKLNLKKFKKKPKWIIGFSDVTVLHSYLLQKANMATIHAPMAAAFNDGEYANEYVQSLRKALSGKKANYVCLPHHFNKSGTATAPLTGGNLSLIVHQIGTLSDINTKGKILFLEDVGEYIYNIDRMFYQLKRAGKLDKLKGLIIGGFTDMKDTVVPFGKEVYETIAEAIEEYNYPVTFQFPVSHEKENYALKVGVTYELKVSEKRVCLREV